jgi:cation diffusion facilitator family transporter
VNDKDGGVFFHERVFDVKRASHFIAERVIKDYHRVTDPVVRARYGALEGWVSIIGNLILFMIKILTGIQIQSAALIADAVHTLADSVTSVVVIIGFTMAKKPSDEQHPFGHGQMEPVVTLVVAVLLSVAGFELLQHSIHRFFHPTQYHASNTVILLISGTIVIKELMARFSFALGAIIDSDALKADALHHRSDVFATALVVVALISARFHYHWVDGVMGTLVSLIIFYSAYSIAKTAINPLLGAAPPVRLLEWIHTTALTVPGVSGVHDIIFHQYGSTTVLSLHIETSDQMSAGESHDLSEIVEEKIGKKTNGLVVVHVDPINRDHPQYKVISDVIDEIIRHDDRIVSFHDLRIVGSEVDTCNVIFDLSLSHNVNEGTATWSSPVSGISLA